MTELVSNHSYTRYEIADALDMPATDLSNLRRELKKRGYEFETSGRGNTYMVEIKTAPKIDLVWFAKTFFGLNIQYSRAKDFANLIKYLLSSGINQPLSYVATRVNYHEDTIRRYVHAIRPVLFRNTGEDIYYGVRNIKHSVIKSDDPNVYEIVRQKKMIKQFSKEQYDFANEAYWMYYDYNKDGNNPDTAEWYKNNDASLIHDCIGQKLLTTGGWYLLPHKVDKYRVNKTWREIKLLRRLLRKYQYEEVYKLENVYIYHDDIVIEEPKEENMDKYVEETRDIKIYTTPDIYFEEEDMYIIDALEEINNTKQYKKLQEA